MKVTITHPTSNQLNRPVVQGLYELDMLYQFHTSVAAFPGGFLDKMSSIDQLSDIKRRNFPKHLEPYTHTQPLKEIGRMMATKLGIDNLVRHETGIFSIDALYHQFDKKIAGQLPKDLKNGLDALYHYEDGALESFTAAKKLGIHCMYDLPIGYWRTARKMLQVEQERWPEWASTLTSLKDSEQKLQRKDDELALAERIFVASSFTAKTLKDYPGKLAPIEVIPYGFPKAGKTRDYNSISSGKKLKILYVGLLSQRKGIADTFAIAENLSEFVELTVVGRKVTDDCPVLDENLAKHEYIPSLAHKDVLSLMHANDILIFPSLFEGFGMVVSEAMSQGTPVITTDRTAGPDIINHDENGWLIEAGSTEALQKTIEDILQKPEKIKSIGRAARESAKKRPWEVYGREVAEAIAKHISSK
ncbi:glycosyltransferase family 4 protein [Maribacter sp. Asnod1-A12]|uniref:glycosyltransferase family 4 protein n=1 Tax=Maribacter sp. Asnod1-A12 TaxID=3160576 RepID=UPI0038709FAF